MDRPLRSAPDTDSRRGLPSDDLRAPAGVGQAEGSGPGRREGARRPALATRPRAAVDAGGAGYSPRRRRPGGRRSAVGLARRRHGPRRPDAGRARAGLRLPDRARSRRRRPRRRRGRPGRAGRGGVRGLGGSPYDRARRRRCRRAGGLELPDPQLPRLSPRARRRRARPARVPAGLALRHPVAGRSPSRRTRARRARLRRAHRRRRASLRSSGRPRSRCRVPQARCSGLRRPRGRGHLLRRVDVGGAGIRWRGRLRRRRRQLGRAGRSPSRALRGTSRDPRSLADRSPRACPST